MTSIALVVLDTLRTEAFDRHFDWLPGRRFSTAFSTSHWTVPAHASLFTGRYASEVGVYAGSQHLPGDRPVLAERLRTAGYTTRAISTNVNISELFDFDRGFEHFANFGRHYRQMRQVTDPDLFDWSDFASEGGTGTDRVNHLRAVWACLQSDCATLPSLLYGLDLAFDVRERFGLERSADDMGGRDVLERVRETEFDDQEFLFLNLMETHGPYAIPESYRSVESFETPDNPIGRVDDDIDLEPLETRYNDAAAYLSDVYRELFEELTETFDLIVTISDHGELLGEHGYCYHAAGLYPELTHIPLSIYTGSRDDVIETPVSILDVHSTILRAAGLDDTGDGRGIDLRANDLEAQPFLTEYHGVPHPERTLDAVRSWLGSDDAVHAYQRWRRGICLENGYYGYETVDGFREDGPAPATDPKSALESLVEPLQVQRSASADSPELPESVREELEHLGYL